MSEAQVEPPIVTDGHYALRANPTHHVSAIQLATDFVLGLEGQESRKCRAGEVLVMDRGDVLVLSREKFWKLYV